MRFTSIAVVMFVVCVLGSTGAGQEKEGKLSDVEKSAKRFIEHMDKGEFEKATKDYDEAMQKALPADKLGETWKTVIAQVGALKKQAGYRTQKIKEFDAVLATCEFEKATLDVRVVFNSKKQISGLQFVPSKK